MKQRIIKHPLMNIVLEYDETKPETDYEKELLKEYISIHDNALTILKQYQKLVYEYKELESKVEDRLKKLVAITHTAQSLNAEMQVLAKSNAELDDLNEMHAKFSEYLTDINQFHYDLYEPLKEEQLLLDEVYNKLTDEEEVFEERFDKHHENASDELYTNWANHSLDLVSYDNYDQEFRDVFSRLLALEKDIQHESDLYEELVENMNTTYALCNDIKLLLGAAYNNEGKMDSSLSDSYLAGTGDESKKPIYLIPPGHEKILNFKRDYGLVAHSNYHTFHATIDKEVVESNDIHMIEDVLICLQHYPKLIDKFIFSIDVELLDEDEQTIPVEVWKGKDIPIKWFNLYYNLPCSIFFFSDADIRSYILLGDLLIDNKFKVVDQKQIIIEGDMLQEVCNRLFSACIFFMIYCHNTGFNPQVYIEALLAELDLPVTFEMVQERFEEDLKNGIKIMSQPMNLEEEDNKANE